MKVCGSCNSENLFSAEFCNTCGRSMTGTVVMNPKNNIVPPGYMPPDITSSRQLRPFHAGMQLRLVLDGHSETVAFELYDQLVLGRHEANSILNPDVDLGPYAAYILGVSRRHARINCTERGHLLITDLGSSNGTFINGIRLSVNKAARLNHGAQLRLGKMEMTVEY